MSAIKVAGVAYREIAGSAPVTRISLAWRVSDSKQSGAEFPRLRDGIAGAGAKAMQAPLFKRLMRE